MQSFARSYSADEFGAHVGSGYTTAQVDVALKQARYQTFRYEVHRKVSGAWSIVVPYLTTVRDCTIRYKRTAEVKRTATFDILDDGSVDFMQDVIRCFWQLRMPDGNYAEWCMGTFYLSSPTLPLTWPRIRTVQAYDSLWLAQRDKMTDWLVTPQYSNAVGTAVNLLGQEFPLAGILIPSSGVLVVEKGGHTNEPNESVLEVVNYFLVYAGFEKLFADLNGSFISRLFVRPSDRANEFSFADWPDPEALVIRETPTLELDLFDAPNRWVGYKSVPNETALRAVYNLTDPQNPQSQPARGNQIITKVKAYSVPDQAALEKALRDEVEADMRRNNKISFETPLYPCDHGDMHELVFSRLIGPWAVRAVWYEDDWEFPCVPDGRMSHTLERALTAVPD